MKGNALKEEYGSSGSLLNTLVNLTVGIIMVGTVAILANVALPFLLKTIIFIAVFYFIIKWYRNRKGITND